MLTLSLISLARDSAGWADLVLAVAVLVLLSAPLYANAEASWVARRAGSAMARLREFAHRKLGLRFWAIQLNAPESRVRLPADIDLASIWCIPGVALIPIYLSARQE